MKVNRYLATLFSLVLIVMLSPSTKVSSQKKTDVTPDPKGVDINKDRERALSLFKGRFIIRNEVNNPADLPGSLLMIDNITTDREEATWTKVDPTLNNEEPELKNEIIYQSVVDKGFVANANYLTFNASVGAQDKVELIVEDVLTSNGPQFAAVNEQKLAAVLAKFRKQGRFFYYIQSVKYTTVKHRLFKKVEGKAQFTGVGFGADGNVYASKNDYSLQRIVSINYVLIEEQPQQRAGGALGALPAIIGNEVKDRTKLKAIKPNDRTGLVLRKISSSPIQ